MKRKQTMDKRKINIDKQIDKGNCPGHYFCTVATTGYDTQKREHICYLCWKQFCQTEGIEIIYD